MSDGTIENAYGGTDIGDVTRIPPDSPLDFGTLNKIATNLPALSSEPTDPDEGWVYLDDGTNTPSSSIALRLYKDGTWQTVGKGAGEDKYYVHSQDSASDTWNVNHGLSKKPSITVVDSANNVVLGEVSYDDNDNVTISFENQFSGKAYLN